MEDERAALVAGALARHGYAGLICRLPHHVLMLTGYLPILGNSFCVLSLGANGQPQVRLAVPTAEREEIPDGAAVQITSYHEETLDSISTTLPSAREPLGALLASAGLTSGPVTVGYEGAPDPVPTAYTQLGIPGPATLDLYRDLLPRARLRDASAALVELMAFKTAADVAHIRAAVATAQDAFAAARAAVRVGATEADVAALATGAALRAGYTRSQRGRTQAHVHVMAGARAAQAHATFNLTTAHPIRRSDTVLVQVEVAVDGYWAELTRTFFAENVSDEWARVARLCLEAQRAAMASIRDGQSARVVDAAARAVLRDAGLGTAFKHGLGHGVGFQAINHSAAPILHPQSHAALRAGMVHNLEPAVYLDGRGGFRLNDDVLDLAEGAELLSATIPRDLDWLVVSA